MSLCFDRQLVSLENLERMQTSTTNRRQIPEIRSPTEWGGTIAGERKRVAREKNPPGMGRKDIISPRVIKTAYMTVPMSKYPNQSETGPPIYKALPD